MGGSASDSARGTGAAGASSAVAPNDDFHPAWRDFGAHARLWFVAVGGLTLDLWSKDWAFRTLDYHTTRVLIPHVLEFQTVLNPGALFGLGRGMTSVFLVASAFALALVFWMFLQSSRDRWLFHIALGGIFAGALGNFYDRVNVRLVRWPVEGRVYRLYTAEPLEGGQLSLLEYPPRGEATRTRRLWADQAQLVGPPVGHVRDFIKIPTTIWGRELWPWVFNVADMLLVGGVSILALTLWTERPRVAAKSPGDAERADGPAAPLAPLHAGAAAPLMVESTPRNNPPQI